jgi:hypothetical protein
MLDVDAAGVTRVVVGQLVRDYDNSGPSCRRGALHLRGHWRHRAEQARDGTRIEATVMV